MLQIAGLFAAFVIPLAEVAVRMILGSRLICLLIGLTALIVLC